MNTFYSKLRVFGCITASAIFCFILGFEWINTGGNSSWGLISAIWKSVFEVVLTSRCRSPRELAASLWSRPVEHTRICTYLKMPNWSRVEITVRWVNHGVEVIFQPKSKKTKLFCFRKVKPLGRLLFCIVKLFSWLFSTSAPHDSHYSTGKTSHYYIFLTPFNWCWFY